MKAKIKEDRMIKLEEERDSLKEKRSYNVRLGKKFKNYLRNKTDVKGDNSKYRCIFFKKVVEKEECVRCH